MWVTGVDGDGWTCKGKGYKDMDTPIPLTKADAFICEPMACCNVIYRRNQT